MRRIAKNLWNAFGPILISALSFFVSFLVIQSVASLLDPSLSLLANKGLGKFALSAMAFLQIALFLSTRPYDFLQYFIAVSLLLFREKRSFIICAYYFCLAFCIHGALLFLLFLTGNAVYNPLWGSISFSLLVRILTGFFVAFLLAWSEELIFRGMLLSYFLLFFPPLVSIIIESFLFMLAHNLANPLELLSTSWQLGVGLFLLGIFLSLLFFITGKLYVGIGFHMGLVAVKVLLRRAPFLEILQIDSSLFVLKDVRQSLAVHAILALASLILIYVFRQKIFQPRSTTVTREPLDVFSTTK